MIAGIWAVKNKPVRPTAPSAHGADATELVQPENDTDFLLETDAVDLDVLTAYGLPIILDFGSDSCIPCKEMAPVLHTVNAQIADLHSVVKGV